MGDLEYAIYSNAGFFDRRCKPAHDALVFSRRQRKKSFPQGALRAGGTAGRDAGTLLPRGCFQDGAGRCDCRRFQDREKGEGSSWKHPLRVEQAFLHRDRQFRRSKSALRNFVRGK